VPPPELAPVIPISRASEAALRPAEPAPSADTVPPPPVDTVDTLDTVVERMLAAIPAAPGYDRDTLREWIEATHAAGQASTACADACLAGEMVGELSGCIRTLLTTPEICQATARVPAQSGSEPAVARELLTACWTACRACRDGCEGFALLHDHCRVCARACRAAERACRALLASLR
jgi:hypothetical protein